MERIAPPVVILISGTGSTMEALIHASEQGILHARVAAVISDRSEAAGLRKARQSGIPAITLERKSYPDTACFEHTLIQLINAYEPQLVILAGFMRILSANFVAQSKQPIINIHPSLLPKHRGLNTYRAALDAGDTVCGTTVHVVTDELDAGPILQQRAVGIFPGDDIPRLRSRVQAVERMLYPLAINQVLSCVG